jgi:hypothetical protein
VVLTGSNAWAQAGATAQISGVVRDQSGSVLPGVDVTATQTETGVARNAVTDADGSYLIPNLAIGPYRLDVKLQGFRSSTQTGIVLQVGSSPVVNVTLQLGELAETVTVEANSAMVETKALGIGQVMDNDKILDLPLNGRNPADLLQFLPAVVPGTALQNATSRSMQGSNGGLAFSVAGGLFFGVGYTLDGATHNNPYDNLNLPLPFPDALQEFKAETSALTAQNGMHSAAAVSAVTKSGTNQFRGDLFEFLRHHDLNATDPFAVKDPVTGKRKDDGLKRNQYGGTLGGPIQPDKVFFFFGYQGTNTRVVPTDNRAFVPTADMLAGDFTAYASAACNNGVARSLGAPFVGNRINPSQFSRAALNIVARLPTTNDPCGLTQYGLPSATDEGQYVVKIDYQMDNKHSVFGRYIATKQFTPPPYSLESAEENLLVTRIGGRDNLAQTLTVGENWVVSPTTMNSIRFAYNKTAIHRTSTDFFSAPDMGVNIYSYTPHYMLLIITGGFQLGGGTESNSTFDTPAWQFSDDLTLVRGSHQFVFGVNTAHWTSLSRANVRSPGQLAVDGAATGLGLADFMVGRLAATNGLQQAAPNTLDMSQTYLGVYAQDTWRVGERLTLNYGVRWEPQFPQQLVNGAVYQFDMGRFQQGIRSTVFPTAPPGLYFPGDPGFPTQAGMLKHWDMFGPRVGVAWDLVGDGRTSLRAAYGKSFEFINGQFHLNTSVAPPWGAEVRLNAPPGGLDDPFLGNPQGNTNIFPIPSPLTATNAVFSLNGPYLSLSNDLDVTNVQLWNVTFERQFGRNWIASAGYVGSKTSNIWESTPLNNAVPGTTPVNTRRPLTLMDPVNGPKYGIVDLYVTDGEQRYDGMLLSLRGSNGPYGSMLAVNYTLAHCYGSPEGSGGATVNPGTGYNQPNDPGYDDGNCGADRLHNFAMTAGVQSPESWGSFGKDWRVVGGLRAITGPWMTVLTGLDRAQNGQIGTQRVNQVLADPYGDKSINPVSGGIRWLNPQAFAQPSLGTFGDMPRNSVRGPGYKNVDITVSRVFRLAGTTGLEVRVEAFNVFNWVNYGLPGLTLNNTATFGQITSILNQSQRIMQLAVKYSF